MKRNKNQVYRHSYNGTSIRKERVATSPMHLDKLQKITNIQLVENLFNKLYCIKIKHINLCPMTWQVCYWFYISCQWWRSNSCPLPEAQNQKLGDSLPICSVLLSLESPQCSFGCPISEQFGLGSSHISHPVPSGPKAQ